MVKATVLSFFSKCSLTVACTRIDAYIFILMQISVASSMELETTRLKNREFRLSLCNWSLYYGQKAAIINYKSKIIKW